MPDKKGLKVNKISLDDLKQAICTSCGCDAIYIIYPGGWTNEGEKWWCPICRMQK